MKILIVEDDRIIAEHLKAALEKWTYQVTIAENFIDIQAEVIKLKPDLVLMDINLPYFSGYHHCSEIRKISDLPIVFISSKNDDMDIVMAMQFGADDYITKPISSQVLIAKIQAILRRVYSAEKKADLINYGAVNFKIGQGSLLYNGQEVNLTKTEMMIISSLMQAGGNVVDRTAIIEKCWHGDDFIDDNTLAVNITRLRKKLKAIGLTDFIMTKKGIGYYLNKVEQ